VLGNGVTPSAADVAVYADLHSSVPGLGKAKTTMMLRNRFLGKLPKPGLSEEQHNKARVVVLVEISPCQMSRSTHERLKKTMVRSLVTTTIASQIHPYSPGSCSQNEPDLKRELSRSYVGFSDGVADSVFEASTMEDPVKVAAEVELCGKGGGSAKN
ncbi:hypothetical protein IGI04_039941, partial [Brassica rapa subsp. trilocularis]